LRGRFVIGYDPGSATTPTEVTNTKQNYGAIHNKGGSLEVKLTTAQLPPHHHEAKGGKATISIIESGKHQHTVKGQTGGDNNDHSNKTTLGAGDKGANETGFIFKHTSSNDDTHSHPNSFFSGIVGNGTTQGLVSESHENRPPYYVLAFIMRVK
jgi:microcystin-dependent protein